MSNSGSEAPIGGHRPSHYLHYNRSMPYSKRVDLALEWLSDGANLVALYFEAADDAGHK